MYKKLLAGLAAVGLLTGGTSAAAAAAAGAPAAFASTTATAPGAWKTPDCGPLGPLVANHTITHAQAVAIHDAFINYVRGHWRNILDTVLSQQVKNHTITHAQASAITSAIVQWIHKYRSEESNHHAPCHYGHSGA